MSHRLLNSRFSYECSFAQVYQFGLLGKTKKIHKYSSRIERRKAKTLEKREQGAENQNVGVIGPLKSGLIRFDS